MASKKPKTLSLFLHARGRHTPDWFASADENSAYFTIVTAAHVPRFLNLYTMHFRKDPKRYGEIIHWGNDMQAFEDMKSRRDMLPGHGLMVLEIQERIYHFLVDCCRAILHDIPASEMTTHKYPMQCEPAINDDVTTGFASLSIMASEAPYRLPAKYDLTPLRSLFSARVAAAEDNIWSLREDPS
ncbi:hypothetical protein LTR17_022191 [Elasticomyces elasticus]|nr:hypothetical protein LTR17_022191 [Elasticomyces elasticus]